MANSRLMIAGTHSGVGKTTITLGLIGALMKKGLVVQGFKVGPDYIDPSYHAFLTGRPSRNLDSWLLGVNRVREVFCHGSRGADLSVIEGVMGLYDGKDPLSNEGTTAQVSSLLKTPVILVIDASGMARSAAAVVKGYQSFDSAVSIAGIIANRVGSEGHYQLVKSAIESTCQVPVVGYLPFHAGISMPERHLGLIPAVEQGELSGLFQRLAEAINSTVDLGLIQDIADRVCSIESPTGVLFTRPSANPTTVIAVARDAAFNFYYPENLELLEHFGARLVFFSPLKGDKIPSDADGLYIGGGFPEEFAAELSRNSLAMGDTFRQIEAGLPTYAECGGYMYLAKSITDRQGHTHPMVGVIPARVTMQNGLAGFGYREVKSPAGNWLLKKGDIARGHEFHYSTMEFDTSRDPAYQGVGTQNIDEGYMLGNVVAGYTHLHFGSNLEVARQFVQACVDFRSRKISMYH